MKHYTHCGICLAACGMEVEAESANIINVSGDRSHPLTKGFLCPKGASALETLKDPLRILHPYEKTDGGWRRSDWKEVVPKIADRLSDIIERHGPQSVALYYGAGTPTSSMNYVMADSFLRSLGSDQMYNVLTLEFTNRYLVMEKMYGSQFRVTQPDLERTRCLLIFGSNPLVSLDHPGITASLKELKRRGAKLLVVDPRLTETARLADMHAQILPGTDLFMLQAMYSHIFSNNLQDESFFRRHCSGADFFSSWRPLSPADAEKLCGVPRDHITKIAEEFARAESACAVCKLGINTSLHGSLTYWLVEALNAVTGNLDRPGGLLFNPGILDLDRLSRMAVGRKQRRSRIGRYPYLTGSYPASVLAREILSDAPDRVRALIVDAGDPALVFPNSESFQEARQRLDLIISIDLYMNETAQLADFVLPAAHFLEKDDLYVTFPDHFPHPFAQWSYKIVDPPGQALAEWEIFLMLSRAMNKPLLNQPPMDLLFKFGKLLGSTIGRREDFAFNPRNYYRLLLGIMGKVRFGQLMKHPHGVKVRDIEFGAALKRLATPSGKVEVAPPIFTAALARIPFPQSTADKPFLLITGERSPHTKNTNLRGVSSLLGRQSENYAKMNPRDAQALHMEDGEIAEIKTSAGTVRLPLKYDENIRPGVVSIGHGWGRIIYHPEGEPPISQQGANVNLVTDDSDLEPFTGMPVFNAIPCSVRRAQDGL